MQESAASSKAKRRRNRRKCRKIDASSVENDLEETDSTTTRTRDDGARIENLEIGSTSGLSVRIVDRGCANGNGGRLVSGSEVRKDSGEAIEEDGRIGGDFRPRKTKCDVVISDSGARASECANQEIPTTLQDLVDVITTDLDDDCVILGELDIGSDENLNSLVTRTKVDKVGSNLASDDLEKSSSEKELSGFKEYLLTKTTEQYRVESPELTKPKAGPVKSRSLDDEETGFKITEATSTDSVNSPSECQAVISEVDSEIEWETAEEIDVEEEISTCDLQDLPDRCDSEVVISDFQMENFDVLPDLKDEVEICDFKTAEDFKQDGDKSKSDALNEIRLKKARKRAALESHFLPQLANPRYLDVIQEESESSGSKRNSTDFLDFMKNNDEYELDDDVFEDPESDKVKYRGPQEVMRNWTCGKVLNRETGELMLVRGEGRSDKCLLLDTKILDTVSPMSSCGDWVKKSLETSFEEAPEVVYLEESPSSSNVSVSDEVDGDQSAGVNLAIDVDTVNIENGMVLRGYDVLTRKALATHEENSDETLPGLVEAVKETCDAVERLSDTYDENKQSSFEAKSPEKEVTVQGRRDSFDSAGSSRCSSRATCVPRMRSLDEEFTDQPNDCFAGGSVPTLRTLCLRAIAAQPYGEDILQELAEVAKNLDMNTRKECRKFVRDVKVTTPPVGMNRRSSMEGEDLFREFRSKSIPDAVDHPYFSDGYVSESSTYRRPSRSDTIDLVNIKSPAPSNPENQAWVLGVPTKTDPGVLMCLSKKQSEMKIEPNSADAILDLHNKYLERVTSADIGAVPKPRKPNKDYEYISDSDGTDRVESLYKTEIRKTERSKPGSDDVKFRKTLESWEDPEYSSDDRTKRLLRNELLRTCKSSCSIPYSLDTEKKDENMDMSSIDRLHRLYKSEMRLAQPNKELSMKRNIVCPKTDDSWIKIYDASNYEESIQNRLKSDKSIHQNIIDKSSTLSLNEQDLRKKDDVDRRRFSLPKELHEKQMQYILEKERQIQKEIDKLQHEKELLKLEELAVKTRRKSDDAKVDKRSKNRIFDSKIQVLDEISELDDCVERLERLAEEAKKVDEAKSKADDHKMPNKKYRDLFGELTPHQRLLKEIEEIENLQYPLPRSIDNDFYELKEKSAESQVIFNKMYEANQKNDEDKPNPFKKYIGEDFDDLLKNVSVHPKSKITKSFSQYDVSKIKEEESEKSRSNFDINLDRSKTSKKVDLKSPEEKLREQMYSEYMSKVAEREYRKHQHVIKLSKIHQEEITSSSPLKPKYDIHASTRIENEFMQELKKRHDKLGIHDDEDSSGDQLASVPNLKVFDGSEVDVCDGNKLPKHLLEFAKLTTDLDDDHSVLHVREDSQNLTCFHEQFSGVTINPNVSPKLLEESRKSFKEVTEFQNLLSDVSDEESSRLFDLLVSEDKPGASKVAQDAKEGQISSNGESRNARLRYVGIAACVAVVLGWKFMR